MVTVCGSIFVGTPQLHGDWNVVGPAMLPPFDYVDFVDYVVDLPNVIHSPWGFSNSGVNPNLYFESFRFQAGNGYWIFNDTSGGGRSGHPF